MGQDELKALRVNDKAMNIEAEVDNMESSSISDCCSVVGSRCLVRLVEAPEQILAVILYNVILWAYLIGIWAYSLRIPSNRSGTVINAVR